MDKKTTPAVAVLVAALVGMAYTHIKDVGMKFDEHVYYMAYLFCANIVAAIAVASFTLATRLFGTLAWLRRTLRAAIGLALSTIAGFMWSRTVGFPQMSDHIGDEQDPELVRAHRSIVGKNKKGARRPGSLGKAISRIRRPWSPGPQ